MLGHASKKLSAVSSTPFGYETFRKQGNTSSSPNDEDGTQQWCGPFSVARQMIAAREEARRKREEELGEDGGTSNTAPHPLDSLVLQAEFERKRKANPSITWKGKANTMEKDGDGKVQNLYYKRQRRYTKQQHHRKLVNESNWWGKGIPSLFQLCINFIVRNFEFVETLGLSVDSNMRKAICEGLVRYGKMNGAAFDVLSEPGIESLEIIDCIEVTQEQFVEAMQNLLPMGLRAIILTHAGRCFGPKAVDAITNASDLEEFALSLEGAYLLKDEDAGKLIAALASSLTSIALSACPLIGAQFCSAISHNFSLTGNKLLEISLEDLPLSKEALLLLSSSKALNHLKNISLKQIEALDDEALSLILSATNFNLSGIHIQNNINLTDESLSCIRRCNGEGNLRALQLSGLKNLSSAGLEAFFTYDIPELPTPPSLRMLDLSACNDASINDIVIGLAIDASSFRRPTSTGLESTGSGEIQPFLSTIGGLVFANISNSSITDKTLEKLAAQCQSSLQELNVSFSSQLSDKGVGYLVSKLGNQFSKLSIWGNAQITDEFLDGHNRVDDGGLEIEGAWMKQSGQRSLR